MTQEQSAGLAELLGTLAVKIQDQTDKQATLRAIVDGAVALVPGARWAGISLIDATRVAAQVPTDALVAELDQAQSTLDEGPCLSAREKHTIHIDDMAVIVERFEVLGEDVERAERLLTVNSSNNLADQSASC